MRILSTETESRLYALEAARGWKRSGLISSEQLPAIEEGLGELPAQAGWAVRLLLFGFALCARGALNTFAAWTLFGRPAWSSGPRRDLAAYYFLTAPVFYLLGEWALRRWRLYRFGAEEGLLTGALLSLATGLAFQFGETPWRLDDVSLIVGLPLSLACAWLYVRAGYAWAAFGAAAALIFAVLGLCTDWSEHGVRALAAGLFAALLGFSFLRRQVSDHDRLGWQSLQASLFMMACFVLNLRLERLADLAGTKAPDGGPFYWATFVLIALLPAAALAWAVRRRHRPMLAAGMIAALVAVISVKPYLGLARHAWDPAVLGLFLMGLSLWLKRWLDQGKDGQRAGFTAKPLVVGRSDGPDMMSLVAAATAAGAAGPSVPGQKGFSGQGGSSGGAGAGGGF